MTLEDKQNIRFRVLPVQVIELADGVLLRRGSEQFAIRGEGASGFLQLLAFLDSKEGFSYASIANAFSKPDREKALFLIRELGKRGMVSPAITTPSPNQETEEDVFYWNFQTSRTETVENLSALKMCIVGIARITVDLCHALSQSGVKGITVIDDALLRTRELFDEDKCIAPWPDGMQIEVVTPDQWQKEYSRSCQCIVACSDFGGRQLLLPWNAASIRGKMVFLPISLRDYKGFIGPLTIPGETPCYNCALTRMNMHEEPFETGIDKILSIQQQGLASHPFMYTLLANMALGRLLAFAGRFPTQRPDDMIELDCITLESKSRRILKIPRCPVCSSLQDYPGTDLHGLKPLPQ